MYINFNVINKYKTEYYVLNRSIEFDWIKLLDR